MSSSSPTPSVEATAAQESGDNDAGALMEVGCSEELPPLKPNVLVLEVRALVRHRYARTDVYSVVENPTPLAQEVTFSATLPEEAFISSFAITVGGRVYPARVEGREEARTEYQAAVRAGRTAGHVQLSARHANLFHVALHVAAHDKAAFNLSYEQLLSREQGRYRVRIMLHPGQVVKRLLVEARIRESANLTLVRVANLRAADSEVDYAAEEPNDPFAKVQRLGPREAIVRWEPDEDTQRRLAADDGAGLKGLLEVQYDVEHSAASTLLVGDGGYFVHFFSPPSDDLPPLPKHVVFLLDTSGSMSGRKIDQLKEAMAAILEELRDCDVFSLLTFATGTSVWVPGRGFGSWEAGQLRALVDASREMVAEAIEAVELLSADGGTQMYDALEAAFAAVAECRSLGSQRQALVFFLTDGEPNGPRSSHRELLDLVASSRGVAAPLYSLAFGGGADFAFLKKLSLRGQGFARKIYEAADAALQLRNFYRRVASPLLADVRFQYAEADAEAASLTQAAFPVLLAGAELAVAGRLSGGAGATPGWATVEGGGRKAAEAAIEVVEERENKEEGAFSLERLWAFLTVRQLLERADADEGDTGAQEARERARQLALRYSFVTPLTSLIVVKPGDEEAPTEVQDASASELPLWQTQALSGAGNAGSGSVLCLFDDIGYADMNIQYCLKQSKCYSRQPLRICSKLSGQSANLGRVPRGLRFSGILQPCSAGPTRRRRCCLQLLREWASRVAAFLRRLCCACRRSGGSKLQEM